ncbi:hypothetical protein HYALB_00011279 [Hymenoscyphus albidus]|uniref:endo-polygalacturonase n=1 Tax=Hymenoscyphus albidus TaxID=595503 RepID=A0A9N9LVE3_9HELO|nr:hypothetical protein HYALB_00011279 [Hymenoscyphus albidus]
MVQASTLLTLVAASVAFVSAAPATHSVGFAKRATCTFSGSNGAAEAKKNKGNCSTITLKDVAVPAGQTLDLTKLKSGTKVIFQGTTTFGYEEWSGPLISVSGSSITVSGASGHLIDGNGIRWWDNQGGNGGKDKPKFFYAHSLKNSVIENLSFKDTPVQLMSINSVEALQVKGISMDNKLGDTKGGHNTDAFDVGSSTGVAISGANIVNQDDCIAINSGTDITFTEGRCIGGHGLSIGSVGGREDNTVSNVMITSSTIKDSDNGVRVKAVYGATGAVKGVTYKDITLQNIAKYGIVIQQDYKNGSPTGKPTTGVPITGLTLQNVKGTVKSSGKNIYILCGKGSCSSWNWSGISVTGGKQARSECTNVPSGVSC